MERLDVDVAAPETDALLTIPVFVLLFSIDCLQD